MERTAVVTGGTRGLGAAVCARLVQDGYRVVAVHRSAGAPAQPGVTALRADLSSVAECRRVADKVGPVTHLVNNAGVLLEARVTEVTEELWDQVHDVNLKAAFFLTQALWPGMVDEGFGRVVNVSSVSAMTGNPVEAAYGAAKAGLTGLTRSLALAGARKGITVNCVVPGVYETDMTNAMSAQAQERIAAMIPVGRRGRPEELAHVVHALLADDAGYTTGATVVVGGGVAMGV